MFITPLHLYEWLNQQPAHTTDNAHEQATIWMFLPLESYILEYALCLYVCTEKEEKKKKQLLAERSTECWGNL